MDVFLSDCRCALAMVVVVDPGDECPCLVVTIGLNWARYIFEPFG